MHSAPLSAESAKGPLCVKDIAEGRPLVVLHGGTLDHRHMEDALEPAFAMRSGWRRLYVDLPGCGGSRQIEAASQDDVLDAVAATVHAASRNTPCAIAGESRGSYIARGLAYRYPDRVTGLALIVPGDATPTERDAKPRPLIAEPGACDGLEPALRSRAERLVVLTSGLVDKIRNLKLPAIALHDPAQEARIQHRFRFSFHDAMEQSRFDRPSLVISGRQDRVAGFAETMARLNRYPRATFALLDTAGHAPGWERPEVFRALIIDWLDRVETT